VSPPSLPLPDPPDDDIWRLFTHHHGVYQVRLRQRFGSSKALVWESSDFFVVISASLTGMEHSFLFGGSTHCVEDNHYWALGKTFNFCIISYSIANRCWFCEL
jgi:hypothetical protein